MAFFPMLMIHISLRNGRVMKWVDKLLGDNTLVVLIIVGVLSSYEDNVKRMECFRRGRRLVYVKSEVAFALIFYETYPFASNDS